ncbi:MAG TPA: GH92 family glycosyl hydrolase [Thermoleophilaceae bacterium]|nr:GH92 family glycosyl hydrolase [Thermoleophilaceae bacterium]
MRSLLTLCVLALVLAAPARAAEEDLARHVDPTIGTFAPGFIFPGAAAPFGMVQNSPDTRGEFAYSGYLWSDPAIQGFSLVHLSGPGVKKGGDIPVMPVLGEPSLDPNLIQSPYEHATERAEAGYYRVFLPKPATTVELTASTRTAMQRYTFPAGPVAPKLVIDPARSVEGVHEGGLEIDAEKGEVSGWSRGRYPVFFVARFSRPFDSSGKLGSGGWVGWDQGGEVTVSFGISFVDEDGARRNLEAEAPHFDFDRMRADTRAAWNQDLSRIRVSGGSDGAKRSFYTALYRAQLHPNVFTDVDGRYRGLDDQVHVAEGRTQYSNFSSWDLYKSENQLLALIQPERYRDMLLSLLADHREGGFIPRWKEQSIDASHMSGDPAIPMIADGICRDLVDRDDAAALYDAARHLVTLRDAKLLELGWLPDRPGTTLEYGVADFSLGLIAHWLGRSDDAAEDVRRSLGYRNILDPETRWIRGRDAEGNWADPFDPTGGESPEQTSGRGFQEGNSWQYSWLAMHDAAGLYERMGGDGVARERLDHMFTMPPELQNRATAFGLVYRLDQWAPGNEHDLQVPWMYHFAGAPWRAAAELAEARVLYRPTIDGLPGNDDLGGLSAWHLLSSIGLGALVPGAPFYALGSPEFDRAEIQVPGGAVVIQSPGAGPYVVDAKLDGQPLDRAWLYSDELRAGATLRLARGSEPDTGWGAAPAQRPPSYSDSPLARFGCGEGKRPRIRLKVRPRRVEAGKRTRVRVRATVRDVGRTLPLADTEVRLGGRRKATGSAGRATLRIRPKRAGALRARARKPGYRAARTKVRVVDAR